MSYRNIPPATSPKPYSQAPLPYRPGGQNYRSVDPYQDVGVYPPPPPLESYEYEPQDDFPPPPPPAPPQSFGEDDGHTYSNVYSSPVGDVARYARTDSYRRAADYGSPRDQQISAESNYANIQINIAPPTPTNKEFGYGGGPTSLSPANKVNSRRDGGGGGGTNRPTPGPMVPVGGGKSEGYSGSAPVSKEAEVDALTDLLVKNMTTPSEGGEDENFWGVCGKCGGTVSGETNACSAMDSVFHIGCFTCVGCDATLQGKSFFAMENKPYCETCYISSLERCSVCSKPITDRLLRATGKPYHPDCFTCVVCGKSLDGIPFTVDATNQIHCIEDFHKKFAPRCCVCQHPIMPSPGQEETVRIVAMDRSFHVDCYRCEDCKVQLSSEAEGRGCYPLDDHILCKNCNAKRIQALTTKMTTEL